MSDSSVDQNARPTHVLDTSVLLADPLAPLRFAPNNVVIPLVAILELQTKRNHPDLGWNARQALGELEDLRVAHGGLAETIQLDGGGTLTIEANHQDVELPAAMMIGDHDHRVLAVCVALQRAGNETQLVSKDLPLRLKAGVLGIEAGEYQAELATSPIWSGFTRIDTTGAVIDSIFEHNVVDLDSARELPCHTGVALQAGSQSALGRVRPDKQVHLVRDTNVFDVRGRSAEQKIAIDLLADPEIGVVSLGGPAGTGKSLLAIASGIQQTLEEGRFRRVLVFRPLHAVGGQDLGYLPGTEDEKMDPWAAAVFDTLTAIAGDQVRAELEARKMLEVLPLTHIRGRTLSDSFVIIDEAQNLERSVLLTALSRLGENSKAVLTHDIAQRDNLRVGRHDGVVSVIEALSGHPLFAHISLIRSERSAVAAMVGHLLDNG